jgi:GNAT superfamily N-acetyltransferase
VSAEGLDIVPLRVPERLEDDDGTFAEMIRVRNETEAFTLGTDVLAVSGPRLLAEYHDPYSDHRVLLGRYDGRIIGRVFVEFPHEAGSRIAILEAEVHPDHRAKGFGRALLAAGEALAEEQGRDIHQAWVVHRALRDGEDAVVPPTGFGRLPSDDPGVRFLLHQGWLLQQIYRISLLDLPAAADDTRAGLERGHAGAGDDYSVEVWVGATPERELEDMAALHARMATDAPQAGMEVDEEDWTPERVRTAESLALDAGILVITAVVRHRASGRLVGFSYVTIPEDRSKPADHGDTLVLREHRGRRLGLLVKAALHEAIPQHSPETRLITTFNAEENRYMLDVNEALGYVPIGYQGVWEKRTH